jgi:hypothetical protein
VFSTRRERAGGGHSLLAFGGGGGSGGGAGVVMATRRRVDVLGLSVRLIIDAGLPLSIVDHEGMRAYTAGIAGVTGGEAGVKELFSGVNRAAVTREILALAQEYERGLIATLREVTAPNVLGLRVRFSASADEWTDIGKESWVLASVTYVKDARLHRKVFFAEVAPTALDKLTALALRGMIDRHVAPIAGGAPIDHVMTGLATDNASVPLAMYKDIPYLSQGCIDHLLDLVWRDLLPKRSKGGDTQEGASPEFGAVVTAFRLVLVKFAHSNRVLRAYKRAFSRVFPGEIILLPAYPVATRCMLARVSCVCVPRMRSLTLPPPFPLSAPGAAGGSPTLSSCCGA